VDRECIGRVLERSFYSPYGQLEAVISNHPFDYDDDGDADEDDAIMILADCDDDYSGDCRRLDADGDRDVDGDDHTIIDDYEDGLSGDTDLTRVPSASRSRLGNPFAHQGLALDAEIASYQNRARQYNPTLKRFMQRDPLGPQAARNCYAPNRWTPLRFADPMGTTPCTSAPCSQPTDPPASCCPAGADTVTHDTCARSEPVIHQSVACTMLYTVPEVAYKLCTDECLGTTIAYCEDVYLECYIIRNPMIRCIQRSLCHTDSDGVQRIFNEECEGEVEHDMSQEAEVSGPILTVRRVCESCPMTS
jgi:RHS repeat-associated protein